MANVKRVSSMKLDTSKLRDLAGSLKVLEAKSLKLVPILEGLAKPVILGQTVMHLEYRTEGGVSALEKEFAALQLALNDARKRIEPALNALKDSLQ